MVTWDGLRREPQLPASQEARPGEFMGLDTVNGCEIPSSPFLLLHEYPHVAGWLWGSGFMQVSVGIFHFPHHFVTLDAPAVQGGHTLEILLQLCANPA